MKWFNQFGLDRAAKAYAKRLPAEMNAGWGSSEVYTIGQVKAAIRHLGLKGRYIAIAYAAFLTKEDFTSVEAEYPTPIAYDAARELFERHRQRAAETYRHNPMSNADAVNRYGVGSD